MKKSTSSYSPARWLVALLFLAASAIAVAEEDSIVVNPDGDYVITYKSFMGAGDANGWVRVVWVPSTKIDPTVTWDIKQNTKSGTLVYSYTFANGASSRQDLEGGRLIASSIVSNSLLTPSGWDGTTVNDWGRSSSVIVGWSIRGATGIKPNSSQSGFSLESVDLPGIWRIECWGYAPANQSFPDEGPGELSPIREKFANLTSETVPRTAVIPRISVPSPFDAGIVIAGIKTHIDTDLVNLKLIDPILVSQLDRSLQAAIDAAKIGNITAVKSNLRDARRLLREQVPDVDATYNFNSNPNKPKTRLIDPMAAWVLNFDLQYVERRL